MVDGGRTIPTFHFQVSTCDNILPSMQMVVEKDSYSGENPTHLMHVPKCSKIYYKTMDNVERRTST